MKRGIIGWATAGAATATLLWGTLAPAIAAMAAIETVQPLENESDEAVTAAIERAVKVAVTGAIAMGLPQVELQAARVLRGAVAVQIIARDDESATPEEEPAGALVPTPSDKPTL